MEGTGTRWPRLARSWHADEGQAPTRGDNGPFAAVRPRAQAEGLNAIPYQVAAARELGISQPRGSDLVRGKWQLFGLDILVTLAACAGRRVELELAARAIQPR